MNSQGKARLLGTLLAGALLAGTPGLCRAAEPKAGFVFVDPYPHAPSHTLGELGLEAIREDGVLVIHSQGNAKLAGEVARVLEMMNRLARSLVGSALRIHGLVLVPDRGLLPSDFQNRQWVNVDGVACLVLEQKETGLPFADELSNYLAFPLLVHENVDLGLKAEVLGGGLTQDSVSSRWWVEGISDFCAYQAARKFQKGTVGYMQKTYREGLQKLSQSELDLEDTGTWWPKGGSGKPENVVFAYASAHYAISALSADRGAGWIRRVLVQLKTEGKKGATTSADFCKAAGPLLGRDVAGFIRRIELARVKKFADSL